MDKGEEKTYCTIYLVRHGETIWNRQKLIQGHTDSRLTEEGERQAEELGKKFRNIVFAAAFSSDLIRAKRTAELITLEKKLAVQTTAALRERYFGWYEGVSWAGRGIKIRKLLKQIMDLTFKKFLNVSLVPDEETDESLMGRFITNIREIAVGYRDKNVLVVSHGGVMRKFLIRLGCFKETDWLKIGNTAYVILSSDGVDFFVKDMSGIEKKQ